MEAKDFMLEHKIFLLQLLHTNKIYHKHRNLSSSTTYYFCVAGNDLLITSVESLSNTIVYAFYVGRKTDKEWILIDGEWDVKVYNGGDIHEMYIIR